MTELTQTQIKVLIQLKGCKQDHKITTQQYKTLRGQVFAGSPDAALKGLRKLLLRKQEARA